jgi:hypothetical protein
MLPIDLGVLPFREAFFDPSKGITLTLLNFLVDTTKKAFVVSTTCPMESRRMSWKREVPSNETMDQTMERRLRNDINRD